jgi:hypothetical protein
MVKRNMFFVIGIHWRRNTVTNMRTIVEGLGGVLAIVGAVVLSPLLAPWYRRWGATAEETQRSLPGDALAPHPRSEDTCAITMQAPVGQVWPWLVQLGCQRAGWYSYDLLDKRLCPGAGRRQDNAVDLSPAARLEPGLGQHADLPRIPGADLFRDGPQDAQGHQTAGRSSMILIEKRRGDYHGFKR